MKIVTKIMRVAFAGVLLCTVQTLQAQGQQETETQEQRIARKIAEGKGHMMTPEEKALFEQRHAYFEARERNVERAGGGEAYEIQRIRITDLQADYNDNPCPETRTALLDFVKQGNMFLDLAVLPPKEVLDSLRKVGKPIEPRRFMITDMDSIAAHFDAVASGRTRPLSLITHEK